MQLRGRGNDQRIELFGLEHAVEVGVAGQARVLGENVGQVRRGVAAGHEVDSRVGAHDREVRQAHLAQADHGGSDHVSFP